MTIVSCSLLLLLAVFSVIYPKEKAVLISLIPVVCLSTFFAHITDIYGIIAIFAFTIVAFVHFHKDFRNKISYYFSSLIFITMIYYFIMHKMPGFCNPIVVDHVRVSQMSSPFSMNINFDKVICALLIFKTFSVCQDDACW